MKVILEETYPDDLFFLNKKIEKRQIADYKMQLSIAHNPHMKEQKELWDILNKADGVSRDRLEEKLDKTAFARLKQQLSTSNAIKVK